MSSPFNTKTAAEIRKRLLDIGHEEESHAARDLDAELAEVMAEGGDVDAIEQAHLEAERVARRLRVERRALETALPAAERREAGVEAGRLAAEHEALTGFARASAQAAVAAWHQFREALAKFAETQKTAERLTHEAARIAEKHGADLPAMGLFNSAALTEVFRDFRRAEGEVVQALATADQRTQVGKHWTLMARPIDRMEAANDQAA